jgi:hemolysin activation/secretion protein
MALYQHRILTASALWALSSIASAQIVPGTVLPGQIERQFQPLPTPRAKPSEKLGPAPLQTPPSNAAEIRFTLKSVTIEGATIFSEGVLRGYYERYLNREVSLADVYAIANAITARYRDDGYILSQAIIPPQSVEGGGVRISIVEGYVADVTIEGDLGGRQSLVDAMVDKIKKARPLQSATLERYLLLLNDLPGVTARATLAPSSTQTGASDLVIQFSHRTASGGINVDNHGSKSQGPWRLTEDLDLNSIFGLYDKSSLKLVTTGNKELNYLSLTHEELVGTEGGKFALNAAVTRAEPPVGTASPATLQTSAESAGLTYSYPLVRSRSTNLYGRLALTAYNGEVDVNSANASKDHIRALRMGTTWDYADAYLGINIVDLEFSQGLRSMGASHNGSPGLSRATGKSDFSKVTLYGARLQSLTDNWSVLAAVNAQYAFSDLLTPELFAFGGDQFGRGYDPSELVGDSGAAVKFELRYAGSVPDSLLKSYTAYGFYDLGVVNQRTLISAQTSGSAASVGLGLRFNVGRYVSGFLELTKPLTHTVQAEGGRDARAYLGIGAHF